MAGKKIKIGIDLMGGDNAPANELEGIEMLLGENQAGFDIILIGNRQKATDSGKYSEAISKFEFIESHDDVLMKDEPAWVLKNKKKSSMYLGVDMMRRGEIDGFVSAGNTGAFMALSTILLGRLNGVSRPTVGTLLPTITGDPVYLLDVGANVDSRPKFLYEYALMGDYFIRSVHNVKNPRVALLNVGEEKSKGTDVIKEAYGLLENSNLNFVGNIEGRDLFFNKAEVVVCDGYTGNIILKFAESIISILKSKVRQYADKSLLNKIKAGLTVPILREILSDFDYQKYGGLPLLGVNGISIVGHGKSSPEAIKNMLLRAFELSRDNFLAGIENAFEASDNNIENNKV
jgi:glycerol-3-phosphate acyltransferase PlsX